MLSGSGRSHRYSLVLSVALHAIVFFAVFKLLGMRGKIASRGDVFYVYVQPALPAVPGVSAKHAASPPQPAVSSKITPLSPPPLYRINKHLHLLKPPSPPMAVPVAVTTPSGVPLPANSNARSSVSVNRVDQGGGNSSGDSETGIPGGHGDEPVSADQVPYPPVPVIKVLPDYPVAARYREIQGRVVLQAIINRFGQVEESVTVLSSVSMFDDAAVAALRKWRFIPGRDRNGQPVRVIIEVPLRFTLR